MKTEILYEKLAVEMVDEEKENEWDRIYVNFINMIIMNVPKRSLGYQTQVKPIHVKAEFISHTTSHIV